MPDLKLSYYLASAMQAMSAGDRGAAYRIAKRLARYYPDDREVQRLMEVARPPEARPRKAERSVCFKKEGSWLSVHAREYPGCWLAVQGDALLAHGPSLRDVRQRAGAAADLSSVAFWYEPAVD